VVEYQYETDGKLKTKSILEKKEDKVINKNTESYLYNDKGYLEKINILALAPKVTYQNPLCPKCGKRLKSMGKHQGFRCEKCGSKFNDLAKVAVAVPRDLETGLYVTSTRSQRHLTKPLSRYGLEKCCWTAGNLIDGWHS